MRTLLLITLFIFIISLLSIAVGYLTDEEIFVYIFLSGIGVFFVNSIILLKK
jgi:hypothetical protein